MTILYFTATGNSLYAARKIGGELISIPQAIKNGRYEFSDDVIGVVCPLYANRLPKIVDEFLNKAILLAEYKFLIITFGHTNFGADGIAVRKYTNQNFDYVKTLLTVDNYLPSFDVSKETLIEKRTDENLDLIRSEIANRTVYKPKIKFMDRIADKAVEKYFAKHGEALDGTQITVTDRCVGCGVCVNVCPKGNFYIADGRAERKRSECEFCLACANLCPQKAIICSVSDVNPNARYLNPNVKVNDITEANRQNQEII